MGTGVVVSVMLVKGVVCAGVALGVYVGVVYEVLRVARVMSGLEVCRAREELTVLVGSSSVVLSARAILKFGECSCAITAALKSSVGYLSEEACRE